MTILLIDPDEKNKVLLSVIFKDKFNLLYANSYQKALLMLNLSIDLIILEIYIDKCQYKLLKEIKKYRPKTPVIILTTCCINNEMIECLKLGCKAFLSKPINAKQLLETCNRI